MSGKALGLSSGKLIFIEIWIHIVPTKSLDNMTSKTDSRMQPSYQEIVMKQVLKWLIIYKHRYTK